MNETQWIKSLDRGSSCPATVDVADGVMGEIRRRGRAAEEDSLAWPALLAAVAGCASVLIALELTGDFSDPLAGILDSFQVVLQ